MRVLLVLAAVALAACGPSSTTTNQPPHDLTTEAWYPQATEQLAALGKQADDLFKAGRVEEASAIVSDGQPLLNRLLSASRPTLAAMQAISDFDQLYAQILITNKYYGEARLLYQKNVSRWRFWRPQTPDTEARLKQAQAGIAECDRHITQ